MSNQVFVLHRDLAGLPAVVLLMSFKLSFIPYYCSRTLAARKRGETLQYLAKDTGHVITKSVFISWAEINHASLCYVPNGNFPSTRCVLCGRVDSCEMVELMCHHRWGGHITNHLRLGSLLLMCCMYSCLCRGSKHQRPTTQCFIHCLLRSGGSNVIRAVCSCEYVWGENVTVTPTTAFRGLLIF